MMPAPLVITGDALEVGIPIVLFPTRIAGAVGGNQGPPYAVAADGRVLINTVVGEGTTAPINLIQNWNPEAVQ